MKSVRAFSLIEIMTVVALVGVMAAIAGPRFAESVRRANAPVQVVRVQSFLSEARNLARRTNRCVKVVRDSSGSTLTASTFSTCLVSGTCVCRASFQADSVTTLSLAAVIPTNANVQALSGNSSTLTDLTGHAGADALIFLPDGSTPYGGDVSFPVNVPGGPTTVVRVMPAAGIVRLVVAGQ